MSIREKIADVLDKDRKWPDAMETADAIIAVLPECVPDLPLYERRNGYWGGKCSFGYQVAHTNGDLYRVRLNGKVICKDIKGFQRAKDWANTHNRNTIMKAIGVPPAPHTTKAATDWAY